MKTQTPMAKARVVKVFEYRGRNCVIVKHQFGHDCIYAETVFNNRGYTEESPVSKTSIEFYARVHGGITFSGKLDFVRPDDERFYFGIDFAHAGDYSTYDRDGKQWTMSELEVEAQKLVDAIIGYEQIVAQELSQSGE